MQHLLDFIHEHSLDEQLYLVAHVRDGDLELRWRRNIDQDYWQFRRKSTEFEADWVRVHRQELLFFLRSQGANMEGLEAEFRAITVTQIVFADMVLTDARKVLGRDMVRQAVLSHRDFVGELRNALQRLSERTSAAPRPSVSIIKGGGMQTEARRGHLSLVPAAS